MKKNIIKFVLFIFILLFVCLISNFSYCAYFSIDIDGINEEKYPGYKVKIKELQNTYPNIKLLYTELDWNRVINNEYDYAHGRNLVYTNQGEEWICQECKKSGKLYDSEIYCASKEAVQYMIDPRNFLNLTDIFQFQKLDTPVGTNPNEIKQVLEKQKVLYLKDDNSSINAFANVAEFNKINAYHLITRVIQEQGRNGNSVLSSGMKFIGTNGKTYQGLYNLFSIGASGNNSAEVWTNALERANKEGWTSRALSIEGGGAFVGNSYINVGQNTLYLQKFSVYNTNNHLFWHQYMQNIFAAQSEASILYNNYKVTGIQYSKDFEFIIPIYENMPSQISLKPTLEYSGAINTEIIDIDSHENDKYICGHIYIAEWVEDNCKIPRNTPKITIKSTDGVISKDMYVSYVDGIKYYFDINLENIDLNKEYYIEAKLISDKNISPEILKVQIVNLPSKTFSKKFKNKVIKISNNKIRFTDGNYIGCINTTLNEIKLMQDEQEKQYICGFVDIGEWIENNCNAPKTMPEIWLKSTDGTVNEKTDINYDHGITYYFNRNITYIDLNKEYYFEAILVTEENLASLESRTQILKLGSKEIGELNNIKVISENNIFSLKYVGVINTEFKDMGLIQDSYGNDYISGHIYIAEWINGECRTPITKPEIKLKSVEGEYEESVFINYEGGIQYYFDKNIESLDTKEQYYLEVYLTSLNNISEEIFKKQIIIFPDRVLSDNGRISVVSENNKIKIIDTNLYYGVINTELPKIEIIQNYIGENYISGHIYIAEWINGECRTPMTKPEIKLKSVEGEYEEVVFVNYEGGIQYYFDKNIEKIDIDKEYYLEVKLTNKKNMSSELEKTQIAKITQQGLVGNCTNGNRIIINGINIIYIK